MATQLFLRNSGSNGISYFMDLSTTRGVASKNPAAATPTTASGTNIQFLRQGDNSQGAAWISGRSPVGGWTLSGLVTVNLRANESSMNANVGGRIRLYKRTAAGSESEIGGSPWDDGVEFGTADAAMNWTFTPTSTDFAEDDRLIVRFFGTNVGTMAAGFTFTMSYDGPTAAAAGDSYVTLNETVAFKANDPFDNIIHFNGTDGSTTIPIDTANSAGALVNLTASDNAQLDTAQQKFGTASCLFDGTGDRLFSGTGDNRHPMWCFGRDLPFTIDFWVRFNSITNSQFLFSLNANNTATFSIAFDTADDTIVVHSNSVEIIGGATTVTTGTWYHIALTQDSSNNMRLFLDGVQQGSTFDASGRNWDVLQGTFSVPEWASIANTNFLDGWIDEFRTRVGEAVWTANFTPPTQEYPLPEVDESLVFDPRSYFNNVLAVR